MKRRFKYVFGPVPSRRFGRSLGVDLVPHKTCSFDCIFCQLGRTTNKTVRRRDYVPTADVIEELHEWMEQDGRADIITLAGSGEPTLHAAFGEVIDWVKSRTTVPVALLTNGSLLGDAGVRRAASRADIVKVSVSAWDAFSFQHVNRPCAEVTLKGILEGAWLLRGELGKQLWIEVFIAWGVNSVPKDVAKLASIIRPLKPDRIQLNTAVRPPAEAFVRAAPEAHLEKLASLFTPRAEVIAEYDAAQSVSVKASEESVRAVLARRPCTVDQMAEVSGMHRNEILKIIGKLLRTGQIDRRRSGSEVYYAVLRGDGK